MAKKLKNNNSKEKKKRSKREIYYIDPFDIEDNINKLKCGAEEKEIRKNIAINLNNLLVERNVDQEKFAEKVKVSTGSISQYRKGIGEPKITNLVKIADGLNVSINYLIGKSDCPNYQFEDIARKTGLSQKAIEQLYRFQYNYYPFEENKTFMEIDITKNRKIDNFYRPHLNILNSIIEDKGNLFFLLDSINKYKLKYAELQTNKENKDTIEKLEDNQELGLYRFRIHELLSIFIREIIEEGENKN
ncbi:MAG: helix-turn-helix domain-containing protein [Clostridia bacterium]